MNRVRLVAAVIGSLVVMAFTSLAPVAQSPAPAQGGPALQGEPAGRGGGRRGGRAGGVWTGEDLPWKDPVRPVSAAEQAERFWLPAGYEMQAVVTEPDVQEPGQIAFDGNGRMYVVELRGYMQDLDATGQLDPVGRISIHEDTDDDGIYETHGVFVDELVLPRWVMPFGVDSVLTNESNADEVWKFTDTNRDGVADRKELFATGFGRLTNVELQQSGLTWALDNWMYSTVNQFRVRWTPNGILREPTGKNGGQWGLTQDNYGKLWFQAGGSGMPAYFQLPVVYGAFAFPEEFEPGLTTIWGAPVLVGDFAGATNARFPDGSLINATAAAGNDIFRGHRLPQDLVGDLLYGETAGRVVRRLRPVNVEGMTQLRNVHPLSEFIKSTDPLFRPVDITTAPDGTVYVTDMYRGVIEELQWNQPGSYIRNRIQELQLDKVIRHGRIWRLTHESMARDTQRPRMLEETPAELVAHLSHPNGWWRDTAQQLLVLAQDTAVAPALHQLVTSSADRLARIHALWTLEGLNALQPPLVRSLMEDADPQIRIQAIRASETLYKGGERSFASDYRRLAAGSDVDVTIQAMLTMNLLKVADTPEAVRETMAAKGAKGVQIVGAAILDPGANQYVGRGAAANVGGGPPPFTAAEEAAMQRGQTIYSEVCFACHGDDGRGAALPGAVAGTTRAPSLVGSPRVLGHRDYVVHGLLAGLTGPIDGQEYEDVMIPMGANPDEWIADVASYVRNAWGNRADFVTSADVARVRAASGSRSNAWTVPEIEARLPRQLVVDDAWKLTASHNASAARNALGLQGWATGEPQRPGMWLQVELPAAVNLTEIQFDSEASAGRGRGGRAGVPGTPARRGGSPGTTPVEGSYPRGYQVQVSMDGSTWSAPVAEGQADGRSTTIAFPSVQARFVRITQTADVADAPPWAMLRLRLFEAGQLAAR
jgi:mono/diheme cytochrome c family protein/glucose/arabinose dehydrogenase